MVLLMMLDSIAASVRSVRFQSVKANALFATASQITMTQPVGVMRGYALHDDSNYEQYDRADAHADNGNRHGVELTTTIHVPPQERR
jgi:hypothetical protein